ncbi:MAG: type II toxin-antitoxin system MqsR family toxin [Magnetococcus sp. THC-1_WYH]
MEKRNPTYDLDTFKAVFSSHERLHITGSALHGAIALGFGRKEMAATIHAMKKQHFVKSITTHADHRLWQDVYHVPTEDVVVYIKFMADKITEFRLLSFKEKQS